jgi:ADP-ribose diphosphatase
VNGNQYEYFAVERDKRGIEFLRSGDEVLIVALTAANEVILTVEPSAAFGVDVMILPGGEVGPDEHHAITANRELQEEAGFAAHRLTLLGEVLPWSKYLGVRSYIYLGQDLTASQLIGDEDYAIGIEYVPLAEFESWVTDGRIKDARVIAALYMARGFLA